MTVPVSTSDSAPAGPEAAGTSLTLWIVSSRPLTCRLPDAPRIVPFRGDYYILRPEQTNMVRSLIYPVPDPRFPFLGVHFTRRINGGVWLGPNAVLAFAREGYHRFDINPGELWETLHFSGFRKLALKYWLVGLAEMYRDFSKAAFLKSLQRYVLNA